MGVVFTNNAETTLAAAISSTSATSISVTSSSTFPTVGAGEYFYATISDGTNLEIVKITAVSGTTWTVVRASDNTTARTFANGSTVQLRTTAALLTDIQENIASKSANQTVYNATAASSATAYDVGINPGVEANAMVFLDGVMQHHDTFSFSGSTLTFDAAPTDGTKIEVIVDNLINLQSSNLTVDTFTATSGQTAFTLSDSPAAEANLIVFINGVFQNQAAYTISNNTLTLDTGVVTGRTVTVYVINPVNIGTPSDGTVTSAKLSGNITTPGTLTVGAFDVAFDSPTFFVDNANSRVGLGTSSPTVPVDIVGDVKMSSTLDVTSTINGVGISSNITNFSNSILISGDAGTGTLNGASNNTGLGFRVFEDLTSGTNNVALGRVALANLTTGTQNVALGNDTLFTNTTGGSNVAIGQDALNANTTASNNTAVGKSALVANTTGASLTAVGTSSLAANTTGRDNTALGFSAATSNTTGLENTAIGMYALRFNTTGDTNTAVGLQALHRNTTANNNTAVGRYAMEQNTTGTQNVAVGAISLDANTTGNYNTAVGYETLTTNTTGTNNTAIGYGALKTQTTASSNTAIGSDALDAITTGDANTAVGRFAGSAATTSIGITAIGYQALDANTTGSYNTAIGFDCMSANTTAVNNTAVGTNAMVANTTGAENTGIGRSALESNTTASNNTAVGRKCLQSTVTGHSNTAMGETAGQNITGSGNTAIGREAMQIGTGGEDNVALGYQSLKNNTGDNNVSIGRNALLDCTSGGGNVAVGQTAGHNITTGGSNICIGRASGRDITTGQYNVCIAPDAAADDLTTGGFNTYMGYKTNASAGDVSGEIVIGAGNNNHTGKGTNTGFITPNTGGVFQGNNSSSWSTTSDKRIKKNIADNNIGLDAIKNIRVRNFEYRTLDEITDFENPASAVVEKEGIQLGVIAQEIETILPDVVKEESTGVKTVNPDNLTWYLVNAVKELSTQVDELKAKLEDK